MTATVTKEKGSRKFLAWCKDCQDGVRHGTAIRAEMWATAHNDHRHKDA